MSFISIDLGTTNIKVAAYDDQLNELAIESDGVEYFRSGDMVEFDAKSNFSQIKEDPSHAAVNRLSQKHLTQ